MSKQNKNSLERFKFLSNITDYYSEKLNKYGPTPMGVDWNSQKSQVLRFKQLSKIFYPLSSFSVNDFGCGYGAFYDYILERYENISYLGIDLSPDMIQAAECRHNFQSKARFIINSEPDRIADFGIASGIFNVRLDHPESEWYEYLQSTLRILDSTSRLGFAFNCLTSYSDVEKMRNSLYYANPCKIFELCKSEFSQKVTLLHDYELYEFTILVRKI